MRKVIPDYQKKQKLLYVERRDPAELVMYGELCLAEGRLPDALEYYQIAKHTAGLEQLRDMATAAGDAMLFHQATKALGRPVETAEWERLGEQALSQGKLLFSLYAFEQSGNEAACERVRDAMQRGNDGQLS